jgi:molybdenum cofactor cytidylyltransferase
MRGTNKLLEPLAEKPLVAHVVDGVLAAGLGPIVVVIGHEGRRVASALAGRPIELIENPRWMEGLSTSVAAGVAALQGRADGALICLGDMPRVSASDLAALIDAFRSSAATPERTPGGDRPTAAREPPAAWVPVHAGRRGNPVLWTAAWFGPLQALRGDRGAKSLLSELGDRVVEVPAGEGVLFDVDTTDELAIARKPKG